MAAPERLPPPQALPLPHTDLRHVSLFKGKSAIGLGFSTDQPAAPLPPAPKAKTSGAQAAGATNIKLSPKSPTSDYLLKDIDGSHAKTWAKSVLLHPDLIADTANRKDAVELAGKILHSNHEFGSIAAAAFMKAHPKLTKEVLSKPPIDIIHLAVNSAKLAEVMRSEDPTLDVPDSIKKADQALINPDPAVHQAALAKIYPSGH